MNAINAYSAWTKSQKMTAEVSRFIEDAKDTDNSLITTSAVEINSNNTISGVDAISV